MARTWNAKVYKESPDKQIVASGGSIEFQSGGVMKLPLVTASSLTDLTPGAVNLVAPTTNAVYKLPAITAGMPGEVIYITKNAATTSLTATIQQATTSLFFGGAVRICVLAGFHESLTLVAGSTVDLNWRPIGGTLSSSAAWSTA